MRGWGSESGRWIRFAIRFAWRMGTGGRRGHGAVRCAMEGSGVDGGADISRAERKEGRGPYSFGRSSTVPYDTVPLSGFGNRARPGGNDLLDVQAVGRCVHLSVVCAGESFCSGDIAAVGGAGRALDDAKLAAEAESLAAEVERALEQDGEDGRVGKNLERFGRMKWMGTVTP